MQVQGRAAAAAAWLPLPLMVLATTFACDCAIDVARNLRQARVPPIHSIVQGHVHVHGGTMHYVQQRCFNFHKRTCDAITGLKLCGT